MGSSKTTTKPKEQWTHLTKCEHSIVAAEKHRGGNCLPVCLRHYHAVCDKWVWFWGRGPNVSEICLNHYVVNSQYMSLVLIYKQNQKLKRIRVRFILVYLKIGLFRLSFWQLVHELRAGDPLGHKPGRGLIKFFRIRRSSFLGLFYSKSFDFGCLQFFFWYQFLPHVSWSVKSYRFKLKQDALS